VALNLTDEPRRIALSGEAGEIVLSTGLERDGERVARELMLAAAEGVLVRVDA
jgi:hypothetical protein